LLLQCITDSSDPKSLSSYISRTISFIRAYKNYCIL